MREGMISEANACERVIEGEKPEEGGSVREENLKGMKNREERGI